MTYRWWLIGCFAVFASSAHGDELERNNWAVLVDTSRYFYNYRHVSNTLTFYHTIKRLGIPDSHIILMLAEDMPCNPRNTKPGVVTRDHADGENIYGEDVEVDYRGDEVSIENFIRILTGRHTASTPRNKRLLTDSMSNVLVYITGHSGPDFIKFQDFEEMTSVDIADAFQQMYKQRRYRNVFWISDTCKAATLHEQMYSPGILAYGSSGPGENSYSYNMDNTVGASLIDRFTFYAYDFFQKLNPSSAHTVENFVKHFRTRQLFSTPVIRTNLFHKSPRETKMSEFFASTSRMRFHSDLLQLEIGNRYRRRGWANLESDVPAELRQGETRVNRKAEDGSRGAPPPTVTPPVDLSDTTQIPWKLLEVWQRMKFGVKPSVDFSPRGSDGGAAGSEVVHVGPQLIWYIGLLFLLVVAWLIF